MFLGGLNSAKVGFFLSGLAAEPTDQPDMSDQKSGTPLGTALGTTNIIILLFALEIGKLL